MFRLLHISFSLFALSLFQSVAQPVHKTNMIGLHYADMQVNQGVAGEPLYGAGAAISYQRYGMEDWAFGFQLSYSKGDEDYDVYGVPYKNDYDVIGYIFTTKYNFLEGKFKLYIGFNLGGNHITIDSNSESVPYIQDQKNHGMNVALPVGFNWFATKNIFVTAGYQAGIIVGNTDFISDAITGLNVGAGYYFNSKNKD